ncbi:Carbohydrate-binding X8 domain superfamily protein [Forsythia ovata]|uniref:Carbohydrate-binding X8 domain superfamily protein n=1 Tax=Forsythia ovata TaxID=205694 RepID=A0ABD1PHF7_9LAMI
MVEAATWCVARSDASDQALQIAIDYACGTGADCAPIQSSGLCYLPNTLQAHASYAFNSYYQRKGNAPGSCSFAGTATIAKTDPSYGSCVYPSSPSTAGGTGGQATPLGTTIPGTTPSLPLPPPGTTTPLSDSGGLTPGTGNCRHTAKI